MEMFIRIPLGKLRRVQPINKLEITHIDQHLNGEQKKRVAKFFREEAAKRTKYTLEPTWTMPETIIAVKNITIIEVKPTNTEEELVITSPTSTIVTDSDELEPEDTLEIVTSPLPESDSEPENSSPGGESPETERLKNIVQTLWNKGQGAYSKLKETVFTAKKLMKEFEGMSKTQLKRQMYKEKTRQIKALKQQHRQ